jgi:hypothetical protein
MVSDLHPPSSFTQFHSASAIGSATHSQRTHISSSHQKLSRAERETQFEREHGSLWTPGLLDRFSLPLTRFHE